MTEHEGDPTPPQADTSSTYRNRLSEFIKSSPETVVSYQVKKLGRGIIKTYESTY